MKKTAYLILVVFALVLIGAFPAESRNGGGGGGRGGHSGGPARTQGGGGHGGGHRGGHGGRGHFSGSVWIGPGWGWGSWWGWPYYYPYYPYYPYYGGYYYPESPVVIERQPRTYSEPEQQEEGEYYWYFCPDAKNYYPYVKKCPKGWLKVVPSSPPDYKE